MAGVEDGWDGCAAWFSGAGFTPMSFGVGREDWAVIVMTGEFREDGLPLWSVAYGEDPELPGTKEEVVGRARERLKRCTKGAGDFEIVRAEPYLMHQRVAAQARKGRVLLAGGALHVSCLPLFRCQGNLGWFSPSRATRSAVWVLRAGSSTPTVTAMPCACPVQRRTRFPAHRMCGFKARGVAQTDGSNVDYQPEVHLVRQGRGCEGAERVLCEAEYRSRVSKVVRDGMDLMMESFELKGRLKRRGGIVGLMI